MKRGDGAVPGVRGKQQQQEATDRRKRRNQASEPTSVESGKQLPSEPSVETNKRQKRKATAVGTKCLNASEPSVETNKRTTSTKRRNARGATTNSSCEDERCTCCWVYEREVQQLKKK